MTKDDYAAKVPDLADRMESARLFAAIDEAARAARESYLDGAGGTILEDDCGDPVCCALSGAPIYETDEIIEIGDNTILAALFIPDGVIAQLRGDDETEEDEEIEEAAA